MTIGFASGLLCGGRLQTRRAQKCAVRMSGVNGGVDKAISLDNLPAELYRRVKYVQGGPDSPSELISAAYEIAAASGTYPALLSVLADMLGFNNPVAASIAVDALAAGGEAAIPPLLNAVSAFNYAANAYALRALAKVGDPAVKDVCLACAKSAPIPNVRRAAYVALGALRYAAKEDAKDALQVILAAVKGEGDWAVQYAAIVALEKFECLHMLDGEDVESVKQLLMKTACANGVDTDGKEKAVDPAVIARAKVALQVVRERTADLLVH